MQHGDGTSAASKSAAAHAKTGVLLMNTGTPDEPEVEAVRRYLREFLMDPYIIGAPEFIRRRIVEHAVKNRPIRTVELYKQFWTEEGSPFLATSRKQALRIGIELSGRVAEPTQVALAMRYGNPSIEAGLAELRDGGCTRVVLVPLYPQNVKVCAGTCFKKADEVLAAMAATGWEPDVLKVESFCEQPAYLNAIAASVRKAWGYTPGAKLVVSFHSTMLKDIKEDDRYLRQTEAMRDWLSAALGIPDDDVILAYQSRFDTRKWLQPFTEQVLEKLMKQGVKDVCVICPGFVADNLETMVEIDGDMREKFTGHRLGHVRHDRAEVINEVRSKATFTYVPALNASSGLVKAVADAICEVL